MKKEKIKNFFSKNKKPISLILTLLISFVLFCPLSFVIIPDQYQSKGSYNTTKDIDYKAMSGMTAVVESDNVLNSTLLSLKENKIKHANGKEISFDELKKGVSTWFVNTSDLVDVMFKNYDDTICKDVTSTIMKVAIPEIEKAISYLTGIIYIGVESSSPIKLNSNRYLLYIGVPVSLTTLVFVFYELMDIRKKRKSIIDNGAFYTEVNI